MQMSSIKTFCDLVESQSFTKTARLNKVTQSAVSQTLSMLEQQFESRFIERSKKNFRLTGEGEVFYDYGKRVVQLYDTMQSKLQEIDGVLAGNIHVATVYSIGLYDLPSYVRRFLKDYPAVNVHVEYRRYDQEASDVGR